MYQGRAKPAPEGVPQDQEDTYKHKWVTQVALNEDRRKHGGETLFEKSWDHLYGNNPSEALFFHGTDWKSLLKILDSGMQIVDAIAFGTMFGKGLYMSDTAHKAAGYAQAIPNISCDRRNSDPNLAELIRIVGPANVGELCNGNKKPVLILRAKPGKLLKVIPDDSSRYIPWPRTTEGDNMKKKFTEFGREVLADFDGVYGITQYREIIIFSPRRMHIVGVAWL